MRVDAAQAAMGERGGSRESARIAARVGQSTQEVNVSLAETLYTEAIGEAIGRPKR